MKDFRRFLVGIDERGLGDHAAHAAACLAASVGGSLELLHAVSVPRPMWMGIEKAQLEELDHCARERAEEETARRLEGVEVHFALGHRRLVGHLRVALGKPHECLLERAREWEADVIFLGPHERRGIIDFGATARRVMHRMECSLWYQPIPYEQPARILVSLDLEEGSHDVLRATRDLAAALGVPVRVLHCFQAPAPYIATGKGSGVDWYGELVVPMREEARRRLDEIVNGVDWGDVAHEVEFTTDVLAEQGILDRQATDQLLVLGAGRNTGLGALLSGSVAYHVVRRADCAVLVLCPGNGRAAVS